MLFKSKRLADRARWHCLRTLDGAWLVRRTVVFHTCRITEWGEQWLWDVRRVNKLKKTPA